MGTRLKKRRNTQTVMGNRRSEEALGIRRWNEEPLGRGLGQEQGGLVQNLTLLCFVLRHGSWDTHLKMSILLIPGPGVQEGLRPGLGPGERG